MNPFDIAVTLTAGWDIPGRVHFAALKHGEGDDQDEITYEREDKTLDSRGSTLRSDGINHPMHDWHT